MTLHNKSKFASLLRETFVVGSVAQPESLPTLNRITIEKLADMIELRLDAYPTLRSEVLPEMQLPLLITARCPAEGGRNGLGAGERSALLRDFLPKAAVVDVEIQSLQEMEEICAEVKASSALLLLSFHDFTGTPSLEHLQTTLAMALEAGADVVKFATTLQGPEDVATLSQLLAMPSRPPLSIMGMGPLGRASRLLFAQLGSVFNYGYLDVATVPGQWAAGRMKELLAELSTP